MEILHGAGMPSMMHVQDGDIARHWRRRMTVEEIARLPTHPDKGPAP